MRSLPNATSSPPPVVLGIDFGGTKIATAVCDLSGQRLATRVIDAEPDGGARAAFDRGVRAAKALLAETAIDRPLAGVGVSTFGIPSEDGVALAPAIDGWEDLAMGRDLREAFEGTPVTMATDVKAAALAEARWGALAGVDPGVYLNLGTGLAAAIVAGGRVLTGANGAAGRDRLQPPAAVRRRLRRLPAAGRGGERPGAGPAGRAARRRGVRGRGRRPRSPPWPTSSSPSSPSTW